jgi:hypothetical protein
MRPSPPQRGPAGGLLCSERTLCLGSRGIQRETGRFKDLLVAYYSIRCQLCPRAFQSAGRPAHALGTAFHEATRSSPRSLLMPVPAPGADDGAVDGWHPRSKIGGEQRQILQHVEVNISAMDRNLLHAGHRLRLPELARGLNLHVPVAAHTRPAGHRGTESTTLLVGQQCVSGVAWDAVDTFSHCYL